MFNRNMVNIPCILIFKNIYIITKVLQTNFKE